MNIYDDSQSGNSNGMAIVIEPILNILILWWNVSHENKRTKSKKKVWEKKEKREQNIIFSYLHRQRNAFCDVVKTILCSIFLLFFLFFLGTVIICYSNEREPHFKIPSKDYVQESPFCYYISIVNINRWTSKHIHSRFLLQKPFRREKVRQTKRARSSLKQFRFASDVLPAPAFFRKNFFCATSYVFVCFFFWFGFASLTVPPSDYAHLNIFQRFFYLSLLLRRNSIDLRSDFPKREKRQDNTILIVSMVKWMCMTTALKQHNDMTEKPISLPWTQTFSVFVL